MTEGVYVAVKVLNSEMLVEHFKKQGFDVEVRNLHVTLAYSREEFKPNIEPNRLFVVEGNKIGKLKFLDNCLIIPIENEFVTAKFNEFMRSGASWDYEDFSPHVTIKYSDEALDEELLNLEVPEFPIILGAMYSEVLDLDKKAELIEE